MLRSLVGSEMCIRDSYEPCILDYNAGLLRCLQYALGHKMADIEDIYVSCIIILNPNEKLAKVKTTLWFFPAYVVDIIKKGVSGFKPL